MSEHRLRGRRVPPPSRPRGGRRVRGRSSHPGGQGRSGRDHLSRIRRVLARDTQLIEWWTHRILLRGTCVGRRPGEPGARQVQRASLVPILGTPRPHDRLLPSGPRAHRRRPSLLPLWVVDVSGGQGNPVVCVSYLAAAELWEVDRFPSANHGAEVRAIERSIAADGPMVAAVLSALGATALLLSNGMGNDIRGTEIQAWLRRHHVAAEARPTTGIATPWIAIVIDAPPDAYVVPVLARRNRHAVSLGFHVAARSILRLRRLLRTHRSTSRPGR